MTRAAGFLLAAGLGIPAGGCAFLSRSEPEFVSQAEVLEAVEKVSGYRPASRAYRLRQVEVSSDMITFYYQGVAQPGDRAWVIRFASKNTEQRPEELVKMESLLEAIRAGKEAFREEDLARQRVGELTVEFVSYRFRSPVRDDQGRPLTAGGVAAITRVPQVPAPLIYHMNVVNVEGNRVPGWKDLEPLVAAIPQD